MQSPTSELIRVTPQTKALKTKTMPETKIVSTIDLIVSLRDLRPQSSRLEVSRCLEKRIDIHLEDAKDVGKFWTQNQVCDRPNPIPRDVSTSPGT